jgi:putative oxidoreductase
MLKFQEQASARGWPNLLLRLILGFGFAAHGWAKLSHDPAHFGEILSHIGVPFPYATAWVTALIELLGGASVMLGAFVIPIGLLVLILGGSGRFSVDNFLLSKFKPLQK